MANMMLLLWPIVAIVLFASLGREKGLIWTVVAGYLLLPENIRFQLPGLPDYNKLSALALSVLLGYLLFRNRKSWPNEPLEAPSASMDRMGLMLFGLLGLFCFGTFMTISDNGGALVDADRVRRGLATWDMVSMVSDTVILVVPFFVAWRLLRTPTHHEEVLKVIVITALVYSLAALYEMRMSPQLNRTFYGYFPHAWLQHVRGGAFRPVVFLQHGLWLAFFLLSASLAALGLFRTKTEGTVRAFYLFAGLWIAAVLFISPNLGAAMLLFLFAPLILLSPRSVQTRVAMIIAIVFLAFPSLRQADLLPLDRLVNFSSSISVNRAKSLQFRLDNEDDMLARAASKPLFGWGGWGRWRVIDEKGRDTTVSDGLWIISLGERGWVGYLTVFGILTLPTLLLARAQRRKRMSMATATIAMIGAANLVYLIPNSALSPIGWLLAGAVAGFISWRPATSTKTLVEISDAEAEASPYTRFARNRAESVQLRRAHGNLSRSRP